MLTPRDSAFEKAGRFLIELALLLLLSAGLVRIVAPELHSILDEFGGRSGGKAEKSSTEDRNPSRRSAPSDLSAGH